MPPVAFTVIVPLLTQFIAEVDTAVTATGVVERTVTDPEPSHPEASLANMV